MDIPSFLSQQRNAGSRALLRHALRPKGGLHFPNMGFSEEKHAQPGLADPPPMVWGSSPFKSALWKGSAARSSHPASASWRRKASASTRIPMDETSKARSKSG